MRPNGEEQAPHSALRGSESARRLDRGVARVRDFEGKFLLVRGLRCRLLGQLRHLLLPFGHLAGEFHGLRLFLTQRALACRQFGSCRSSRADNLIASPDFRIPSRSST